MFFSTATILLPVFLPVSFAAVTSVAKRQNSCSDVHLFLARGNGEAYPGRVGDIANTVCDGLPSCDAENIQFVSTESYCDQASDGVSDGISQITSYASRCPDSKLVLAGYSLGAQIVGDILGGGGGSYYNCVERTTPGMSRASSPGKNIAAVLLFGDPEHVAGASYNVGTGSGDNGQYPRSGANLASLDQYSNIMQNYCYDTDPICALGDDGESHTTYMTVYGEQAGQYVQKLLGFGGSSSSSSSAAPSSTSSSTASSTSSNTAATGDSSTFSIPSFSSSTGSSDSSAAASTSSSGSAAASSSGAASSTSVTAAASSTVQTSTTATSPRPSTVSPVPFSFSNTATVATTSTFSLTAVPTLSSMSAVSSAVSANSTSVFTPPSNGTVSTASSAVATTLSQAGAYSNSAQLTLNLVTLVVIKVLVF
ncbi:Acetylxylan esterase 2 [Hyphodiscus hymeniophilus]|uniref:Acetylxylan esterase 2 n=1 Tax=Hyphodiscus hymeniophilus TaxID=353542 RepID=A0A9P6VQ32_9HELO|nr:Acetylxylan esterase 2 [Hyphodiscus hymeniophilus]